MSGALGSDRRFATYRGERLSLWVNASGTVLVGTADYALAQRLGLARVDKYWFELSLSPDDPDLVIDEQEPVEASAAHPVAERFFARFGADRVPTGLLRRRFAPDGHTDEVLRDVGDWGPDTHGSVSRAIVNPLESDLEEITPAQAGEFLRMVAARSYRPFSR